jgi:DNA-binding response OmpR family regulator
MADIRLPGPGRILVVEDEPSILRLVIRMLTGEGYQVRAATDGRQALEVLAKDDFDLVLLDIMMPAVDGFGVLAQLKASGALRTTRVVMLTALGKDSDWLKGFKAGAHDYVTKPFDHDGLLATVKRLLGLKGTEIAAHREASIERARVLAQLESIFDH